MPVRIAVASGKGGTGKTSVAINLYHLLNKNGNQAVLVDCDVEEPNVRLFFPDKKVSETSVVDQEIPVIDTGKCTFCRKCSEYCEFNAILVIPPTGFAEINPSLCHSCGACSIACEHDAIRIRKDPIGIITKYKTGLGLGIVEGKLNIGSAMQTLVIRELQRSLSPNNDFLILDSPPGTSCPVVESISDADYVVLVTEPTPFGLYDLKLMVELTRELELPIGVIVNKAGLGNRDVYRYLEQEHIPLLGEIPFDRNYAGMYATGNILKEIPGHIQSAYSHILAGLGKSLEIS